MTFGTVIDAAFGAFKASIRPSRLVISTFNKPITSAVIVDFDYPAMSMATLMLPRASPNRASRKSSCLGVSVFVILSQIVKC